MVNTVTCPACGLKHLARPDGACPRCRTRLAPAGASPAVVVMQPAPKPAAPPPPPPAWEAPPPAAQPAIAASIPEPSITLPPDVTDAQARLAAAAFGRLVLSLGAGLVLSALTVWVFVSVEEMRPLAFGGAVLLLSVLILVGWAVGMVSSYRLAQGIGGTVLWLGVLIPGLVGFIFAWVLLSRAAAVFRSWSVPVGPLGPRLPPA